MNISIFGLGYVGAVSLACLARDGHRVVGVDVDATKLERIAKGKTPVVEEGMVVLMEDVVASGRVSVTTDAAQALRETELSLICVGTPSAANGSQDQTAILRLAEQLGVSDKMAKTVTVLVERRVKHPLIGQVMIRSKKYHAHVEGLEAGAGDLVQIEECAPISRTKAWRVLPRLSRSPAQFEVNIDRRGASQ